MKTAKAVHVGKVRTVDRNDALPRQVLIVAVSKTLLGKPASELTVEVMFIPECGWARTFQTTDTVVVFKLESWLLAYRYSSTAYLEKLRAYIRESQSNRTLQPTR